jgi:hypothetical protein
MYFYYSGRITHVEIHRNSVGAAYLLGQTLRVGGALPLALRNDNRFNNDRLHCAQVGSYDIH